MATLINFKICDNDKACSGMAVCPKNVFTWNEEKQSLEIDNSKCISCGLCEKACMVSAIRVAKTKVDYDKIKKEFENDPRTINDLLVERYGGKLIDLAMAGSAKEIDLKAKSNRRPLIIELYNEDSIMCLLKSIKVKEIANSFSENTRYRKIEVTDDKLLEKYDIKELPSLLFFKNGDMIGKIEGYYSEDEKQNLFEKIKKISTN
ncbi:MAG: 4Fe-4S dicluster domain-containing protein [Bacilli bacterium]|nr:4Fe-4S dicluster domain-containing protein [Bacilli bacterium]